MDTTILIAAIALLVLAGANLFFIFRYSRRLNELKVKEAELLNEEENISKREAVLDKWRNDLKAKSEKIKEIEAKKKHIYANFEVLDSQEQKPTMKSIQKSLSSKIGYALRKEFPQIQERRDERNGGRTVYSIDFFVEEYDESI